MQFHILRLFLIGQPQPELWTQADDRETFLRSLFRGWIDFEHRGRSYVYVGIEERADAIVGRLGRTVVEMGHQPPQDAFEPLLRKGWRAVTVILDPRGDPEGQKIAIEYDPRVGKPLALARSLAESINERKPATPWIINVNPITDSEKFWEAARRHKGSITEISFFYLSRLTCWAFLIFTLKNLEGWEMRKKHRR